MLEGITQWLDGAGLLVGAVVMLILFLFPLFDGQFVLACRCLKVSRSGWTELVRLLERVETLVMISCGSFVSR